MDLCLIKYLEDRFLFNATSQVDFPVGHFFEFLNGTRGLHLQYFKKTKMLVHSGPMALFNHLEARRNSPWQLYQIKVLWVRRR